MEKYYELHFYVEMDTFNKIILNLKYIHTAIFCDGILIKVQRHHRISNAIVSSVMINKAYALINTYPPFQGRFQDFFHLGPN